ncbi:MAG: hypothetical protein V2A71_02575 [Candidatus Eisenbacteria bacterium]
MRESSSLSIQTYREASEIQRVGSRAARKAQEESRRMNVPNVYSHNGRLYYELPDGRLTETDPFENM